MSGNDPISSSIPKTDPFTSTEQFTETKLNVGDMRQTYNESTLLESNIPQEPFTLFTSWFLHAKETFQGEVNAMCLSTASKHSGRPSSRMVLLKSADLTGFIFYTNYESRKSKEIVENPFAALNFYWGQRQIRVEGRVEKVDENESDEYFQSRPRGSRIGAHVSKQSQVVSSRSQLDQEEIDAVEKFNGVEDIPRPDNWGGWKVVPDRIEFWQGRPSRLHDRIEFHRVKESGEWRYQRLYP
ncbi:hypothetical protein HK098_001609 [Nowakowskiella sp. JEL0407]|nr:hypothetical protein HK098_001609 [Nowakowskiella sp. JEL0407]